MRIDATLRDAVIVGASGIAVAVIFLLIAREWAAGYVALTNESTGTELATAILYFVAGLILLVRTIRIQSGFGAKILPLLLAVFFLFVAGEEESWGMWILGYEAPEAIASINTQEEITIHNLQLFAEALTPHRILNLFILLFGIVFPVLDQCVGSIRRFFRHIHMPLVNIRLVPWFATALLYEKVAVAATSAAELEFWRHSEISEFLFSVGLFAFVSVPGFRRRTNE